MAYWVKPGESDVVNALGRMLIAALLVVAACITWLSSCAYARAEEVAYGRAPPGFFACAQVRHDPACAVDPTATAEVPESTALLERIEKENATVNDALWKYQCSPIGYNGPNGEPNYWKSYDPEHPAFARRACVNCINYAATKRRMLLAEGLPANALRYAHVRYKWSSNMTHIILLVYTSKHPSDPLVLDSLSIELASPNVISRWSQVGPYYDLLAIQDMHGTWRKP